MDGPPVSQLRCLLEFKTKIKRQRVLPGVYRESGGHSLIENQLSARILFRGWTPGQEVYSKENGRSGAVGGSEGSGADGVLLMASSTSDFWREVLKTPS